MEKNPSTATVKTPSSNFTGDVWMNPLFGGDGISQIACGACALKSLSVGGVTP